MSRIKIKAERRGRGSKMERYIGDDAYIGKEMTTSEIIFSILLIIALFGAITWAGSLHKTQPLNKVNTQLELYSADK